MPTTTSTSVLETIWTSYQRNTKRSSSQMKVISGDYEQLKQLAGQFDGIAGDVKPVSPLGDLDDTQKKAVSLIELAQTIITGMFDHFQDLQAQDEAAYKAASIMSKNQVDQANKAALAIDTEYLSSLTSFSNQMQLYLRESMEKG
jgi:hypothetical protein